MRDRQRRKHKRPNRCPESHNTSGIEAHKFTAPDTDGDTVPISGRVDPADKEFLQQQPEGLSYHVRQAVRAYISHMRGE